jgi:hypothetical protein
MSDDWRITVCQSPEKFRISIVGIMIDAGSEFKIITGCLAAAILFYGFVIIMKQYIVKHYRPSLYLAIAWLGFFIEALFASIRLFFPEDPELMLLFQKLSYAGLGPGFLGILAVGDSISRDAIESKRFAILIFVLGITTFMLFMPLDARTIMYPNIIVISIGVVISNMLLVLYIRIHRIVPSKLKRLAFINIIGAFLVSGLYVILRIAEIIMEKVNPEIFFPPIARLIEAVGAVIQTSILSRYEQLFYVLPFKTQRLIVVGTRNGISLYTHDWLKSDIIDEDLFSSILQGMSLIVNESLKKGKFQEIKMEKGVLLISHDATHPIACVLIASKSSQVLHDGLATFARKFVKKYEPYLNQPENLDIFHDASELVQECFPFIPQMEESGDRR